MHMLARVYKCGHLAPGGAVKYTPPPDAESNGPTLEETD